VGTASPLVETNPRKWDKYVCGRTLYWQVESSTGVKSPIQTAYVTCVAAYDPNNSLAGLLSMRSMTLQPVNVGLFTQRDVYIASSRLNL
jgi:hypothetical protein